MVENKLIYDVIFFCYIYDIVLLMHIRQKPKYNSEYNEIKLQQMNP